MCSRVNRTTVIQYSDDICTKAARFNNSILPRGTQQLSSDGNQRHLPVFTESFQTMDRNPPNNRFQKMLPRNIE